MKTLVIGKNGQLGQSLVTELSGRHAVHAVGRDELDITNATAVDDVIAAERPAVIINAAAYTAVDKAETEQIQAWATNADAPAHIGRAAKRHGARVIHFSTDYVFDGTKNTPYLETDPVNPVNYYGASKLAGEKNLNETGAVATTFRVSWLYGAVGHNFFNTILRLAAERPELKIVNDQLGAPTSTNCIAVALNMFLQRVEEHPEQAWAPIYHLSCQGQCSWYDFACAIVDKAKASGRLSKNVTIHGIPSIEYPTPAKRPAYSRMNAALFQAQWGIELPDWESALNAVVVDNFTNH